MTHVSVDTSSSTPAYEQLQDQLTRQIVGRVLPPGTRLPAIRQLAHDLGIAPGTVARAYRELEQNGLVRTRRAQGTTVAAAAAVSEAGPDLLSQLARSFAQQAQQLGVAADDAVQALRHAYRTP